MKLMKKASLYMKAFALWIVLTIVGCGADPDGTTTTANPATTPVISVTSPTNGQRGSTSFYVEGTVHDSSEIRGVFVFSTPAFGGSTNIAALTLTGGELSTYSGNIEMVSSGWNYVWVSAINEWNNMNTPALIPVEAEHGYVPTNTNVIEDTTPPVVVIETPTPLQQVGASYSFTGTVSDSESGVNSVWVSLDGGSYEQANLGYGKWSAIFEVSPGVHTNTVYARDEEGNESTPITNICEYVAGMPFVAITYPLSGNLTRLSSASVYGTASVDDGSITVVQLRKNSDAYSTVTGTDNWSQVLTLSEGTNTITARAIASTGRTNTSASVIVVLDSTVPTVNITSPQNGAVFTNSSFTISGIAADSFSGVDSVFVAVNDNGFNPVTGTLSWSKAVALAAGNHTLKAYSRDKAGNFSATNQVSIIIEEPETNETTFKVYCMEMPTWTGVRIHYWGGSCGATTWPGEAMIDEGSGWYSYTFTTGSNTSLLFNNAGAGPNPDSGNKSSDTTRSTTGWFWTNGQWYDENPVGPQPPVVSASPSGGSFYSASYMVTLSVSGDGVTASKYTLNGSDPVNGTSYSDGTEIDIASGMNVGDSRTLKLYALNAEGSSTQSYTFTKVDEPEPVTNGGFNNLRIYQVMVESFIDGDPSRNFGTGYGPSHHNGDLQGIINALPYIKSMGFNAVWLTPIFNSDGGSELDATGYFTRYYFQIDPHFGTWEKAKELVDTAHDLGLYVFFDGVFGHHKGGIPASPSGYYPDGGNDPVSYPGSLNFYREVATFWIEEMKIDGWRLDQAYQVPVSAWTDIRIAVENQSQSNLMAGNTWGTLGYMVGEIWNGEGTIQSTGYGPEGNPALYSCFDFPMRYRLVQVLAQEESGLGQQPASKLLEGFTSHDTYASHAIPNLMLGNHDLVRFGDLIQRKYGYGTENADYWKRHKAAFSFMAAYTGPITFYYNEELGHEVANDGSYYNDNVARSSGQIDNLTAQQKDLTNYVTLLMNMRAEHPSLWNGERQNLKATTTIFADLKTYGAEKIVYILNVSTSSETVSITDGAVGGSTLRDLISGEVISGSGNYSVTVPALSGRFLIVE